MYAYLYVSVYVYVYTYLKYCPLQVLPLYLSCTRVVYLSLHTYLATIQPHCCGALPVVGGQVLVLVGVPPHLQDGFLGGTSHFSSYFLPFTGVHLCQKLFPVHGLKSPLHHLVPASEHLAADVLLALLLPAQGEVQVLGPATCQRHPQLLSLV